MKHIQIKYAWLGMLLASDPGRKRFIQASKITLSLISSVFSMQLILIISGSSLFTPAIIAGMVGLLGIFAVMDETKKQKQITTLFLGLAAVFGITVGSILSGNAFYTGTLLVLLIFCAFYFSRFGSRYFTMGLLGFMTSYMSSLLNISTSQLPWFYVGVVVGVSFAYLYNFIIFKNSAAVLRRSMDSYHLQANLTLNQLINVIKNPNLNKSRAQSLEKNMHRLRAFAREVSGDLNEEDVQTIWPGLTVSQLRLYLFDTSMLVETLTDVLKQLKQADALETEELRRILGWVVKTLRDTEVLAPNYKAQHLVEAENAVQALRLLLMDLRLDENSWLFLIRRIESIANHVIDSAVDMQQALQGGNRPGEDFPLLVEENAGNEGNETGLKVTTKKALQALVAGTIAIVAGYIISPIQPYWIILTTLFVLLGTESVGRTYIKGFQRSLGTIFGAVIGLFLAKLLSGNTEIEVTLLFIVVFLAFYFFAVSYTLMCLFVTILIAFMYDILLGGISFHLLGARVVDTVVGALIALAVSAVIFPTTTKDKVTDSFVIYLVELRRYVLDYVKRFSVTVDVKWLSGSAFELDQKLYAINNSAQPFIQRPSVFSDSNVGQIITTITAINYYAKHLVASSYQKEFDYPQKLAADFVQVEEKLQHNIEVLCTLVKGTERQYEVYNLSVHRTRIEQLAPDNKVANGDLIHHLYYVWKINTAIIMLASELGAEEV
ncbi:FUSC family protein [Radiobacillus sp. PE A8.2]|uniref:FUSC family protein n=1 Tax=Radiobacillus sp. PE A8.2 TaxID=3380349 RepID=UPI00388D2087